MSVVVAELSVLTDTLDPESGSCFFTTNIACPSEPIERQVEGEAETETPILSAYLSAIRNIAREGTTINTPEFHALHYVHVVAPGRQLAGNSTPGRPIVSFYRNNVAVTPLNPKYKQGNKQIDFKGHHRDFFEHFLTTLNRQHSSNPADRFHYLAVPFQRPGHLTVVISERPARLEPAGALYLILQQSKDRRSESYKHQIDTIAAHLQYICALACLNASSLLADRRAMSAALSEASLKAYEGIGHALRSFVEATKYEGAIELLAAVEHDDRLPKDLAKTIAHVRRSLAFFEHAEALGSLMRLHGWLGVHDSTRRRQLTKVLECYDEEQVRAIQEGSLDSNVVVTATAGVVRSLASPLAYKDDVVFRIRFKDTQAQCVRSLVVAPDIEASGEIEAEPALPPLRTEGDRGAVFLTISVALLEPLRNASMHVREHERSSMVEVLLEGESNGIVSVYVGNQWYGAGAPNVDMLTLSTGIGLVQRLLKECHLGRFFNVKFVDLQKRTAVPIGADHAYDNYVWIGVELDPLSLYAFAKDGA